MRIDLPNGTYSLVVFDPWMETRWDPNDTVADSLWYASRAGLASDDPERLAADKAYAHRDTPSVVHLDALGRPFLTIEDNGGTNQFATTVELDIEGNAKSITDHRGVVVQESKFAMGGRRLYQKSCDAGERWMLGDVGGALLRAWDQRLFTRRAEYDGGRRPTHVWVKPDNANEILVERTVYGESLGEDAAASNLRGKPYLHYDGAGVVQSVSFDFKGNLLESQRRLATEYHSQVDWSVLAAITSPAATLAAADDAELLEDEVFTAQTAYDALNRPTLLTVPRSANLTTLDPSEVRPTYNEAGLLERVEVRVRGAAAWTVFVNDIDYDAKGQREQIVYGEDANGNGTVTTKYMYDPLTFRMTQLKTTRAAGDPDDEADDDVLQNLAYTYDPVGNITEIHDSAQQGVFFNDEVVLPTMAYEYDALYRLISASGRELTAITAYVPDLDDIPVSLPHQNNAQAVRNYTQAYEYDAVGNILRMIHKVGGQTEWTRHYKYESAGTDPISNRLVATSAFADANDFSATYAYDDHGNMVSMPHLESIEWNYRDEMVSADRGGGGIVYFTYDSAGERVRKVYEHSGLIEERIYLGGFEIYRKWQVSTPPDPNVLLLERETLHVMDGVRRVAMVETKTVDTDIPAFTAVTVVRVQLGNHLGSAALEVQLDGAVISYEEYHPYGTTAYHSASNAVEVSRKRYRYTGKERDEETGLYYHGARYYAPWLGRWTAADPYLLLCDDRASKVRGRSSEEAARATWPRTTRTHQKSVDAFDPTRRHDTDGMMRGPADLVAYCYAWNNPVRLLDPNGLYVIQEGANAAKTSQTQGALQEIVGSFGTVVATRLRNNDVMFAVHQTQQQKDALAKSGSAGQAVRDLMWSAHMVDRVFLIRNATTRLAESDAERDRDAWINTVRDLGGSSGGNAIAAPASEGGLSMPAQGASVRMTQPKMPRLYNGRILVVASIAVNFDKMSKDYPRSGTFSELFNLKTPNTPGILLGHELLGHAWLRQFGSHRGRESEARQYENEYLRRPHGIPARSLAAGRDEGD